MVVVAPFAIVPFVWRGAPFVPSSARKLKAFMQTLTFDNDGTFVDLGSGGGMSLQVANQDFGMRAVGVEINPLLAWLTQLRFIRNPLVTVKRADMWAYELPVDTSVVYIFTMPKFMDKLHTKLKQEIDRPITVITYSFTIPGLKPIAENEGFMAFSVEPLAHDETHV